MAYNFKSESEVKEFLHNLGIEYRFGCYSEKKADVCHLLGDYLEAIKKDFEKAGKVYKSNCDDYNFGKSCYKFGNYNLIGRGQNKVDYKEAYKYFEKGCGLDEVDACLHQGLMLVTKTKNLGIDRDLIKGMTVLEKACNGNNPNACYYLSGMYIAGVRKEENKNTDDTSNSTNSFLVEKDMSKAFKFTLQGCKLGNVYCCANLSRMYLMGEGTEKNAELAEKYKNIALEMQDDLKNSKQTLTFQEGL